jgi:adenine/guanine phosphoribosyltransferase-like PRPP-binding protein
MPSTLTRAPLSGSPRRRARTTFERQSLAEFSRWLIERVAEHRPDFIVPAETKGARVLEAALECARTELSSPIDVQVRYATALAYAAPSFWRESKVLVFEDAVRTGTNLERHRRRVSKYGAKDAGALACIGDVDDRGHLKADCFQLVDSDRYRTFARQITDLVVARGLPPEVDHQVFELRLPERLPVGWATLERELSRYGTLSLDRPRVHADQPAGMTLHFPTLPGSVTHSNEGAVRNTGINKLRLFADPVLDRLHVVPVSFPTLDLPEETSETVPLDHARALMREWMGEEDALGELLLEEAQTRDPETVFRALAAAGEADLLRGLTQVLARAFPQGGVSLHANRRLFEKLYGQRVGERAADCLSEELAGMLDMAAPGASDSGPAPTPPIELDDEVIETTDRIAHGLKQLYDRRASQPDFAPSDRVGRSLHEIAGEIADSEMLLVSRCMDFGLSATTLVPYVERDHSEEGTLRIRREYRVSESMRDELYTDIAANHRRLSEEIVALIAAHVGKLDGNETGGASYTTIAALTGILRQLVLGEHREIELHAVPAPNSIGIALLAGEQPIGPTRPVSDLFAAGPDRVRPTQLFHDDYAARQLGIDEIGAAVQIEGWLELILPMVHELPVDSRDELLAAWAMCMDARLGLTHVLCSLDAALEQIDALLKRIASRDPHQAPPEAAAAAGEYARAAKSKLSRLDHDWAATVRGYWPEPSRREETVLNTLAPPDDTGIYELPAALAALTSPLSVLAERLYEASAAHWRNGADPVELVERVRRSCAETERALTSLQAGAPTHEAAPAGREGIELAAEALSAIRHRLGALAAAAAGDYRGPADVAPISLGGQREATILFVDLAKSVAYAHAHGYQETGPWRDGALNLAAQWARAWSGHENPRAGDGTWFEFAVPGDAAVLCAAAIEAHAAALASTGAAADGWVFHLAVDHSTLMSGAVGNTTAECLDRTARVAKADESNENRPAFVTDDTLAECSDGVRDLTAPSGQSVALTEQEQIEPRKIDSPATMRQLTSQIRLTAGGLLTDLPVAQEGAAPAVVEEVGGDAAGEDDVPSSSTG